MLVRILFHTVLVLIIAAMNLAEANANPIFDGQTPLAYMIRGGLPAMQTVRRLVDARRAG